MGAASRFGCLAAACIGACGLDTNGLEASSGGAGVDATADGGATGADASSGGDGGAAADVGSTKDVATIEASPADGCVAKGAESCTNGVDDDCNGLTDCADPACVTQGYACAAPAPAGWDFVGFDATSQAGCPATLSQKKVDVDPANLSASAQCACTCSLTTSPACAHGSMSAKHGADPLCNGPGGAQPYPASDGACNEGVSLTVDTYVLTSPPPPVGGSCSPSVTVTTPPTGATHGELCGGQKTFGGGCAGGQVCTLVPAAFDACIHHGGTLGCPGGAYPTAHAVGTLQDSRGCSACTCAAPTCGPGQWSFYESGDCSGAAAVTLVTDGQCDKTNNQNMGQAFASNQFTSMPGGCAASGQPSPTGSAQLAGQDTVCCH